MLPCSSKYSYYTFTSAGAPQTRGDLVVEAKGLRWAMLLLAASEAESTDTTE